jgi:hypothetical protein
MQIRPLALALCATTVLAASAGQTKQSAVPSPLAAGFSAIPSPAAEGAGEPNLATDAKGRVWLSWLEPRAGGGQRFRLSSLSGKQWSQPVTIAEGTGLLANWADFPSVFITSDGTIAAHWLERGTARGAYGIRVVTSKDAGRSWTKATIPHPGSETGEHGFVSFFEAPAGGRGSEPQGGGLGLVWLDGRDVAGAGHAAPGHAGGMALRSTFIRNGEAGPDLLVDARVCDCCQTSAARSGAGVLVAYRDRTEKEIRDTSVVRFSNGKWSAPVTVHADHWEINGCPVNGPVVAARGTAAAVAWFTGAGNTPKTLVAFSGDEGRTFGQPIRIDIDANVTLGRLAMAMRSVDRVLVSSLERTGTGAHLVLRDVRRDGRISAPVEIAAATPERSGGFARLAASGTKVVVAWTDVRAGIPAAVRTAIAEVR